MVRCCCYKPYAPVTQIVVDGIAFFVGLLVPFSQEILAKPAPPPMLNLLTVSGAVLFGETMKWEHLHLYLMR